MDKVIRSHTDEIGWVDAKCKRFPNYKEFTAVFNLKGGLMGWVRHPLRLYEIFTNMRRSGILYRYFGMEYNKPKNCFYLCCDEGRLMRPLYILSELSRIIEFVNGPIFESIIDPASQMVEQGMVEYLDAAEEFCGLVLTADSIETAKETEMEATHMEIHGCFSMTPTVSKAYATLNQVPRRGKTGNMEKRSIPLKLIPDRGCTISSSLLYGQTPLQSDPIDDACSLREDEPNGYNIRMAVQPMSKNMEDSWIMKKEAIDRGLAMSMEFPCITVQSRQQLHHL